jgi:hypothetical protein
LLASGVGDAIRAVSEAHFQIDDSRSPLVVVRYVGRVDDDAFRAYLDSHRKVLDKGEPYALLADALEAGVPSPPQRRMQAEFLRVEQHRLARLCVGTAFIISSGVIRGALTAILWMQALPMPFTVLSTRAAGELWCRQRLADTAAVPAQRP